MGGNKAVTYAIGAAAIAAVVVLGIVIWNQFKTPEPGQAGPPPGVGESAYPARLICDDVNPPIYVPLGMGQPMKGPDGQDDPYKWQVSAYKGKTFYRVYRCLQTNRTWAYGKNGQIYSPYVNAQPAK